MKRHSLFLIFGLMVAGAAQAQRQGDQGYGIMFGNPTGISAKTWINETIALDAAVGVARSEFDIHADLLIHRFDLLKNIHVSGELPVYFGFGPRLLFEDKEEFGLRFPVGVSFLPTGSPWEVFGEVAPVLRVTPSVGFNGDFAIGLRYYFAAVRPTSR